MLSKIRLNMKRNVCFIVRVNGNFLKMRVSEIRVKRIRVNQGFGVTAKVVGW